MAVCQDKDKTRFHSKLNPRICIRWQAVILTYESGVHDHFSDAPASHALIQISTVHGRCFFLIEMFSLKLRYGRRRMKTSKCLERNTHSNNQYTWEIREIQQAGIISSGLFTSRFQLSMLACKHAQLKATWKIFYSFCAFCLLFEKAKGAKTVKKKRADAVPLHERNLWGAFHQHMSKADLWEALHQHMNKADSLKQMRVTQTTGEWMLLLDRGQTLRMWLDIDSFPNSYCLWSHGRS